MGQKKLVRKAEPPSKSRMRWPRWTGFRGKTVWDFLQLLIVPLMLAAIGFWFTAQQDARQQRIESQRAEAERELAEQRAQDEALQAYLDQMSGLLLERDLRASEEDSELRTLARARTLTVLGRLDPGRKTALLQFLVEAELVQRVEGGRGPIITLTGANLSDVNGTSVFPGGKNIANLNHAILDHATLRDADLQGAYLSSAHLIGADLKGANLSVSYLGDANLSAANLSDANLSPTTLTDANLSVANLSGADLRKADLSDAKGVTEKQLEKQTRTLEGATMPDGQKYEDWIKDRERRKKDE